MAKRSPRRSRDEADRRSDLEVIRRAIRAIEAVPDFDIVAFADADASRESREKMRRERRALRDKFNEEANSIFSRVQRLLAECLPEAVLPPPRACYAYMPDPRTPFENLIMCVDLCSACSEEAKRALRLVELALGGGDVSGRFLPPQIIAARIADANAEKDRRSRERLARPKPKIEMFEKDDKLFVMRKRPTESDNHGDHAHRKEDARFPLSDTDRRVLRLLAEQAEDSRLLGKTIATNLRLNLDSIGRNLSDLRKAGLIQNPGRQGYSITREGRDRLGRGR